MGCSEGRVEKAEQATDDLTKVESLHVSAELADKVIRKFAPSPYITPTQLQRILTRLDLLPLTLSREAFYLEMAKAEGYLKLHFLVSAIMQGKAGRETKLRLLFETLDEHYEGVVSRDMLKALIDAMVYVSFVYPRKMLPKASKLSLSHSHQELHSFKALLMEKIAVGVSVSLYDLTNLATQENLRDIGTPTGLRRLVSVLPTKKAESLEAAPLLEEVKEAEDQGSKRQRHRLQTEKGKETSEYIRQRTLAVESAAFTSHAKSRALNSQLPPHFFAPSPVL